MVGNLREVGEQKLVEGNLFFSACGSATKMEKMNKMKQMNKIKKMKKINKEYHKMSTSSS